LTDSYFLFVQQLERKRPAQLLLLALFSPGCLIEEAPGRFLHWSWSAQRIGVALMVFGQCTILLRWHWPWHTDQASVTRTQWPSCPRSAGL